MNYADYGGGGGASSPADDDDNDGADADALEQTFLDMDRLYESYREDISPLLQTAELRCSEFGVSACKDLESIVKQYIKRWYSLGKDLGEVALEYRTGINQIHVQLKTAQVEIAERDKIINSEREKFEADRRAFEEHVKTLESVLANSVAVQSQQLSQAQNTAQPTTHRSSSSDEIRRVEKERDAAENALIKIRNENQYLLQNVKLLKTGAPDWQQSMLKLTADLAKKEDEILQLRWLTQDLTQERNALELAVRDASKNAGFVSVTPARQSDYNQVFDELSAFLKDEADDDVSEDPAEHGMLLLEDADIHPQVAKKLAQALQVVKEVSQFASDRDGDAKRLESRMDDKPSSSSPSKAHTNGMVWRQKQAQSLSEPSTDELYKNFDALKTLKESSPSQAHTLLYQLGAFKALIEYMDNDDAYTCMLKRVNAEVQKSNQCIEFITKTVSELQSAHSSTTSASTLYDLQNYSDSLLHILNRVLTELRDAVEFMHPDHKQVELLRHKFHELENTMPYMEAEQLAILNSLPSFLKQELNRLAHTTKRPYRIRNAEKRAQAQADDEQERRANFETHLNEVEFAMLKIKEKADDLKHGLRSKLEQSQTDPKAFAQYLTQIDVACDQISNESANLDMHMHAARDYVHPSQSALIAIMEQYNSLQVDCERLARMLAIKEGELKALHEIHDLRPTRMMMSSSVNGPPPPPPSTAQPPINTLKKAQDSFQFEDIETDFMQFAAQQTLGTGNGNVNGNTTGAGGGGVGGVGDMSVIDEDARDVDLIIPKMSGILTQFKQKTAGIQQRVIAQQRQNGYQVGSELDELMHYCDDLNNHLIQAKQIMGPDAKYIARLEKRYVQIMGLYQMKYAEVENKMDILFQSDQMIKELRDDISDLEYRLGSVMSSAVSNVETRMEAFNEMGVKIQTFEKVMKLVDDTYLNIQQACQDITESVEKDLYDILGETVDERQHQDMSGMISNVAHACDYIMKAFQDIGQEMDGVGQFNSPDRQMVERLQNELIAMHQSRPDNQEKQQQDMQSQIDNMQHNGEATATRNTKTRDIIPGTSRDDSVVGPRRLSIQNFQAAFADTIKRRSGTVDDRAGAADKLQKEDIRRRKHSHRRSSIGNIASAAVLGLLPPLMVQEQAAKSDIIGRRTDERMDDQDKAYLKSLARSMVVQAQKTNPKETPANSPLQSPADHPGSPVSEDDPKAYNISIENAVDTDSMRKHGGRGGGADADLLRKQLNDKQQLIVDLQTNLRQLSENRRTELQHFQKQLEAMKQRCREWYQQLMERVNEMETQYQTKINQEIQAKRHEVEQHALRNEEEYRRKLAQLQEQSAYADSNAPEMDEMKRELARLNETCDKFKNKYFDCEEQKIQLSDQLDEIKEEKFKMEAKMEEMAKELAILQQQHQMHGGDDFSGKNSQQLNGDVQRLQTEVQKLREEKEQQELQYEEEFREFERMANEKVVQLEEYYYQQLQMKEVTVQQLQQLLAAAQQKTNESSPMMAEQVNGLRNEITKLEEVNARLTAETTKLQSEMSKLQFVERELAAYKKKNEVAESKISAYTASFMELAERLKNLNDDTKTLRKEKDKLRKKCEKFEKTKKKLKAEIKDLTEKKDNIQAVAKELVLVKQRARDATQEWDKERASLNDSVRAQQEQMDSIQEHKLRSINAYNSEMNNLRTNIKTLQRRVQQHELENEKLRETDSQSVLGSAANWAIGSNWWGTKK